MDITRGICARCRCQDEKRAEDEPELFSKENLIDPSSVPEHLPALTQMEEMLHITKLATCMRACHCAWAPESCLQRIFGLKTGWSIELLV